MRQPSQGVVILQGGLDLVTPPLKVEQGRLLQVRNYECDLNGGYRLMSGYERFDGHESPSQTPLHAMQVEDLTGWQVGDVITGQSSLATCEVFKIVDAGLYVTNLVGAFTIGEGISGSVTSTVSIVLDVSQDITFTDADDFNLIRYDKELYLRNKISEVPGIGSVLGCFRHLDIVLAARNFDATEARLYKSTVTGWQQVSDSYIVYFDAVTDFSLLVQGITVNDGNGNTATLIGIVRQTAASTTGYLVLKDFTAGFTSVDNVRVNTSIAVGISVTAAKVVFNPNGKFEWLSHNFTGADGRYRVYACDNKNPAFEYDPAVDAVVPLYSDIDNPLSENPKFLSVYKNHLFLGFERSLVRNSESGDPYLYDAAAGTIELNPGSELTGFDSTANALIMCTQRQTYALTGNNINDFNLQLAGERVGARPYTIAHIGTTHTLDDRGIIALNRVEAFGNFENATISRLIQPALLKIRNEVIASTTVLTNNIYKLFTSDGKGISVTFQEGQAIGFSEFDLNRNVNCVSAAEDEDGNERILFGSSDGFVYEMERGRSFDGEVKQSWFRTVYQYLNSPLFRKRFYRAFMGVIISGKATLKVNADFSLGSSDIATVTTKSLDAAGQDSSWDIGLFDKAVFDGKVVSDVYLDLDGTGESISLILNHESATDDVFSIKDIIYTYKTRRIERGAR